MSVYSCCICGTFLAEAHRITIPNWCRSIRALSVVKSQIVLTGSGFLDNDLFDLPIGLLDRYRLQFQRAPDTADSCFPFHSACWALLEDCQADQINSSVHVALYQIFQSIHFYRGALRWGHDCGGASRCQDRRWNKADLNSFYTADPRHFSLLDQERTFDPAISSRMDGVINSSYRTGNHLCQRVSGRLACKNSQNRLVTIHMELLDTIVTLLSHQDALSLLCTCSCVHSRYGHGLPASFWQSRFYPNSEAGFARSIRPKSYSWKSWFLALQKQMKTESMSIHLRNRRRIWKLALHLVQLIRITTSRRASGVAQKIDTSPVFRCLPSSDSQDGCRELYQRFVLFPEPEIARLCRLMPTYISINEQRFVSGLTFGFSNGTTLDVGYVLDGGVVQDCLEEQDMMWFSFNSQGLKTVMLQATRRLYRDKHAEAKLCLNDFKGIAIGLDATHIVSVYAVSHVVQEIYWTPRHPPMTPFIEESDLNSIKSLQKSFAPASFLTPTESIRAIRICTSLGPYAGIDGIKFVYKDGREDSWGSCDNVASITYFLNPESEKVVRLIVYRAGSVIYHLEFVTNLGRKSGLLPNYFPLQQMDITEYEALQNGAVVGLWGCFTGSPKRLAYLGVFTDTKIKIRRNSTPTISETENPPVSMIDTKICEMPIAIGRHGSFTTHLVLDQPFQAVQASILTATTEYRLQGQVAGLLFYPTCGEYPILIGYWTGPGERYDFAPDEKITGITFDCSASRWKNPKHRTLSQVTKVVLKTSIGSRTWGLGNCSLRNTICQDQGLQGIEWEFNATYDRIKRKCIKGSNYFARCCENAEMRSLN